MRVKKYLALTLAAILATTMLTACPWDIDDDAASNSSSAPSSSSRPSYDDDEDDTVTYTITVQPSAYGTASASAASVAASESVTIAVTPEDGYAVDTVTANGIALTAGADGSYTISNIQADQNVQVIFFKKSNFVTAKDREIIRQELGKIKESDDLKEYNIQTLTLTPNDEAFLAGWYKDAGFDNVWFDDEHEDETIEEIENTFDVQLHYMDSSIDFSAWTTDVKKRWVFFRDAKKCDEDGQWIDTDIMKLIKLKISKWLENASQNGGIDQNYTYSMGFFTAEDTEEGEVYLVVILQCDPKAAVAAPVT